MTAEPDDDDRVLLSIDGDDDPADGTEPALGLAADGDKAADKPEPRRRGRTAGRGREAARAEARAEPLGDGIIRGRNGEILTRRRRDGVDPYHIDQRLVPSGWTYQWNAVKIYNNGDVVQQRSMSYWHNGWRPVPASRHPGLFLPLGAEGAIVLNGLRLEERPIQLTEEAQAEQVAEARKQVRTQSESVMGKTATNITNAGFAVPSAQQQRRAFGRPEHVRMAIDPALDAPRSGDYELAEQ